MPPQLISLFPHLSGVLLIKLTTTADRLGPIVPLPFTNSGIEPFALDEPSPDPGEWAPTMLNYETSSGLETSRFVVCG